MTPAARLAAAIELLEAIEDTFGRGGPAADVLVERYFKQRRYAGSHDRRWIIEQVYAVLRTRGMLVWRLGSVGLAPMARWELLLHLVGKGGLEARWFEGPYAVPEPAPEERAALVRAAALDEAPDWARHNVPEWLAARLGGRFGARIDEEMAALGERAPTDLRVNRAKVNREAALEALAEAGIAARPTPWSPLGIRLEDARNIKALDLFRKGALEVQDEASQIACLIAGAGPGEQVAELCAGAGGKTLALSGMMAGRGQIFAMDHDRRRLDALKARAARAAVRNLQIHRLSRGAEKRAHQLARFAASFDLVVIDAPCSGSGTWRRNPELRWRVNADRLADYAIAQKALLHEGMALAKAGGRLAYMTCSLLGEENDAVVATVLAERDDWRIEDIRPHLERAGLGHLPPSAAGPEETLQLSPARHGCDGFFIAILRKGA